MDAWRFIRSAYKKLEITLPVYAGSFYYGYTEYIMKWSVYILECKDGSLYTGVATDVQRRFIEHRDGRGARYTRSHEPKKIVYQEIRSTRSVAQKREAQIKRMTRTEKLILIKGK